jgi:hypothetical protein
MPQPRRFVGLGWPSRSEEDAVAGIKLNEMLRAWGVAGKAAILMLCILVGAQAVGAFASSAHGSRPCHDERAAPAQAAQTERHDHSAHDHASGDHAHASPDAVQGHDEHFSGTSDGGTSHHGGCCGWLCSAATLPSSQTIRLAYASGGAVTLPPASAPETARPLGLFRPPRLSSGIIA